MNGRGAHFMVFVERASVLRSQARFELVANTSCTWRRFVCEFGALKYLSVLQGTGDQVRDVPELGTGNLFAAVLVVFRSRRARVTATGFPGGMKLPRQPWRQECGWGAST